MWEFEIGKNIWLFRTATAQESQQPGSDALEDDRLANDQDDRDQRVSFDMMEMQILEPAREIMEDQEKISGDENGVEGELDQERPQGAGLFLFRRRNTGHLPLFAIGRTIGRASLSSMPDFYLRPRCFFLPSNSLFSVKIMADAANKYPENVAGPYYVDDQCIDCDLCRETAPANYKRNDDGGHSFVYKQPETPEEEALCKEAMEGCPVEAIGNDGG